MTDVLNEITELIVHEVPRRMVGAATGGPLLSEVASPLNDDLRTYFLQKIAGTLGLAAFPVVRDPEATSPVPRLIADSFAGTGQFVPASRDMAQHLFACQTGVNSPGLLVVVSGRSRNRAAFALMKLEKEEGVRIHRQRVRGQMTFDIEHLRELMLTESTKVFKVGLFPRHGDRVADIAGDVSDNQRGYQPKTEIANFFLRQFLGCRLRETPDVTTRRFFELGESFVNTRVTDPEKRARYETAILAELGSQAGTVNPVAFARRHLEAADRDAFLATLRDSGLTAAEFVKDIAQIASRVKRVVMAFGTGVRVTAPAEEMGESVRVETEGDQTAVVTIRGEIDTVGGR